MENKKSLIVKTTEKIAEKGKNIIFTGAGISTESGIPDYRSKGGLWDRFRPVTFDEFMTSKDARIEYWKRKSELYHDLVNAEPNPAHKMVAELDSMGLLEAVITQNIDGLHQKAGLHDDKVVELHGNTCRIRCMSCDKLTSIHEAQERIESGDSAPECECGGYLKPDTISFGQNLRKEDIEKSMDLSLKSDFFMVVGSTLLVQPAANMPYHAKQNGAFLAILNMSETPCDNICDVLITEKAGIALPKIIDELKKTIDRKSLLT